MDKLGIPFTRGFMTKPNSTSSTVTQAMGFPEESRGIETDVSNLVPIPSDAVPVDVTLPFSLYIKIADRYPRFRSIGETLTPRRIVGLLENGVKTLYVHRRIWHHYLESVEKSVAENPENPDHLRRLIVAYGTELENKIKEPKKPIFEKLRRVGEALGALLKRDPSKGPGLLRRDGDPQLYFVNHSLNTAVYAALVATKLGYPLEEIKTLTYAVLVHDIGHLLLPKDILHKAELSDDERKAFRSHCRLGAELLQSVGSAPAAVLTALQHHEREDGKGFPQRMEGQKTHPFARLCAVVDAYDDLTSNRPFQTTVAPSEALRKMREDVGHFDPKILGATAEETSKAL